MTPNWIFEYVRCPISHRPLQWADESDLMLIRRLRAENRLKNRLGESVDSVPEKGWVDSNKQWFYPVAFEIPSLLADEAISLQD
jgi:uncharacterized protein YbaR (Trm112 family)